MTAPGPQVRSSRQHAVPAATAVVLVATGVVTVHLVGRRSFAHEALRSAAPEPHLPLWLQLGALGCVILGVVAAWAILGSRPGVAVGLAVAAIGAAVPAWASWTGAPPELRVAVLAGPALAAAGLAQIVPRWPGDAGRSRLGATAWVFALGSVVVLAVGYDPLTDPWCARVCRSVAGPLVDVGSSTQVLALSGLLMLVAVAAGLLGVAVGRSTPSAVRAAAGASLATVGVLISAELLLRATNTWARTLSALLPWTVGLPAVVVVVIGLRAAATKRAIDQLVRDLEAGRADAIPAGWSEELTPSVQLAIANARLTALTTQRLDDVRAAQRRAVQRAELERRRIERDLHDGAQQTLVSAAFHLGVVDARGYGSPEVDAARSDVSTALARLREVAHGAESTTPEATSS